MGKKEVIETYDPEKGGIASSFHGTERFFTSRGIKLKLKKFSGTKVSDEAGEALNLKPARDHVVRAIDKKIVPKIAPSLISTHRKVAAKEKKRRDTAARALKSMGIAPSY